MRGEGYSDIFIQTYARVIFWVQNFESHYLWGFQKNEYSWGVKVLWIFFFFGGGGGVIEKLDFFSGHFYVF